LLITVEQVQLHDLGIQVDEVSEALLSTTSLVHTWYLVRRVLQTPVSSIMATKNGITALTAMTVAPLELMLLEWVKLGEED
jgi:hypothetical protein